MRGRVPRCRRPDAEPYASEYIGQIVELIQRLLDNGSAYVASGDV